MGITQTEKLTGHPATWSNGMQCALSVSGVQKLLAVVQVM